MKFCFTEFLLQINNLLIYSPKSIDYFDYEKINK